MTTINAVIPPQPFNHKEFFIKRPLGLASMSSEDAREATIQICKDLGLQPPVTRLSTER